VLVDGGPADAGLPDDWRAGWEAARKSLEACREDAIKY
jgi:hypothetical protein